MLPTPPTDTPTLAIALDFDGVVVESVGIKDDAFRRLFGDYDEWPIIEEYHLAHNATVRFVKFRHIYEQILELEYSETIAEELASRFGQLVRDAIVECEYVGGALEFLGAFRGRVPLFLISKTPDEELEHILRERRLSFYFERVFGASWEKDDALNRICGDFGFAPHELVFVGDSPEDSQAAERAGVRFAGRDSGKSFPDGNVSLARDMEEIREIIEPTV
jgi:phosphoglycolate phosphatase-like HAD superfamily hydrolase